MSCVDKTLFSPLTPEPWRTSSWATKLFGGLVCAVAAYLAVLYLLTATGVSDQQYARTPTSSTHPSAKACAKPDENTSFKSCPFSKTPTNDSPKSPTKTLQVALPEAADAASIARNTNLTGPTPGEWQTMNDEDVVRKAFENNLALYSLEKVLGDSTRAVQVRRAIVARNPRTSHYFQA